MDATVFWPKMKLSDAILKGSTLIRSVPYTVSDGKGGGCAIGMAMTAIAKDAECAVFDYPWLYEPAQRAPCGCTSYQQVAYEEVRRNIVPVELIVRKIDYKADVLVHLFNEHVHGDQTWNLLQLVDWVRIEESLAEADVLSELEVGVA